MLNSEVFDKSLKALVVAGDFVAASMYSIDNVKFKGINDPQTNVDIEAEDKLVASLSVILPEAGFILEEGQDKKAPIYNWVIDPIDGTKFFSTLCPVFFTQIALYENQNIIFAAIYQPSAKQLFYAIKGQGAHLNDRKIMIKEPGDISESLINLELGQIGDDAHKLKMLNALATSANRLFLVSGILAPYLMTNTIHAYIRYHGKNSLYDTAPRMLLATEAGAQLKIYDHHGVELLIAAHPKMISQIEDLILTQVS